MTETKAKILFWYLLNAVLVLIVISGLFGIGALVRSSNAVVPSRTITVTGEGKISIKPDLATVSFAVVSQGEKPEQLTKENSEKMNKAIAFVKEAGIAEKDIKTENYNLYPRHKWNETTQENAIIGYELRQTVTIRIRDIEKAGEIVGGLTAAGINEINSLNLTVEDPEVQRDRARAEAFSKARQKAEFMARANGVSIARVISFSESSGGYPIPYYERSLSFGKGGMDTAAIAPDIAVGEQEVAVQVTVTYEIR